MSATVSEHPEEHLARFGLSSFRPGQAEVISAVLAGHDCMCIMPTGGGKSLCYQLPAIARRGMTLVVSPLIALMKDQVDALSSLGIKATFVNSSLPPTEQRARLDNMAEGQYDLIYIAPERLRNPRFQEAVRKTHVHLLAVDEAHCISEWGHDFRPDYARLGRFRQRWKFPQTIALTATATPEVRKDVVRQLLLREPKIFMSGFARDNLHFEVQEPNSAREKDGMLLDFLRENPGAGIVYVSTRKKCSEVSELISDELKRSVGLYNAGLLPDDRRRVQEDFMQDRVQVMVATNAFGMGIDKSDLRFVVHYNMPGTLEAYYQEAGRAGRDGKPSRCLLLYSYQDRFIQEFFIENAYPPLEVVATVYDYLRSLDEDPIEVTLEDLRERLELSVGTEGVGACERLLEKCGAMERMDSLGNKASVRIDSDLPTLVDLLPKEAKVRRKVLRQIEQEVGEMRYERVFFHLQKIEAMAELEHDSVMRALRELSKLDAFDYVPAFRGRAIHMLMRDKPFERLDIDFDELDRRRNAEYEKLDRVINYAKTRRCRQLEILDYFGDPSRTRCSVCDNCDARSSAVPSQTQDLATSTEVDSGVLEAVKMALSGVARARGKFGKIIVARMLCGSKSAEMSKFGLKGLSTFGLLKRLKQPEVIRLLEDLLAAKLLRQVEVDRHRPLVQLTELGTDVMRGNTELAATFILSAELESKLRGPGQQVAAGAQAGKPPTALPDDLPAGDPKLLRALREWRHKAADEAAGPVYRVLTNAAMEALAASKPSSADELLAVKGIGPYTVRRYGGKLLRLIAGHTDLRHEHSPSEVSDGSRSVAGRAAGVSPLTEPEADTSGSPVLPPVRNAPPDETSTNDAPKPDRVTESPKPDRSVAKDQLGASAAADFESRKAKPSFYWTWRLLTEGYAAEQCEQIRRLGDMEILSHALQAVDHKLPVNAEWFFSAKQLAALEAVIGNAPPKRMRALLEQLPSGIRHEHVQLYVRIRWPDGS